MGYACDPSYKLYGEGALHGAVAGILTEGADKCPFSLAVGEVQACSESSDKGEGVRGLCQWSFLERTGCPEAESGTAGTRHRFCQGS